jgi:hypothetical protein
VRKGKADGGSNRKVVRSPRKSVPKAVDSSSDESNGKPSRDKDDGASSNNRAGAARKVDHTEYKSPTKNKYGPLPLNGNAGGTTGGIAEGRPQVEGGMEWEMSLKPAALKSAPTAGGLKNESSSSSSSTSSSSYSSLSDAAIERKLNKKKKQKKRNKKRKKSREEQSFN